MKTKATPIQKKYSQKHLKSQCGSSVVFFCILLSVMVPLTGILIDLARVRLATVRVNEALRLTAESLLSQYNTTLKNEYGFFAMDITQREALTDCAKELLNANIKPMVVDGVKDLYQFQVKELHVVPLYNLSEPEVMKGQILEFMKYRAPLQMTDGFIEKLQAFTQSSDEVRVMDADMTLDREMENLRQDNVYLALMLQTKMTQVGKIQTFGANGKILQEDMRQKLNSTFTKNAATLQTGILRVGELQKKGSSLLEKAGTLDRRAKEAAGYRDSQEEILRSLLQKEEASEKTSKDDKNKTKAQIQTDKNAWIAVQAQVLLQEKQCEQTQGAAQESQCAWENFQRDEWHPFTETLSAQAVQLKNVLDENSKLTHLLVGHLTQMKQVANKCLEVLASLREKSSRMADFTETCETLSGLENAGATTGKLAADLHKQGPATSAESLRVLQDALLKMQYQLDAWIDSAGTLLSDQKELLSEMVNFEVILQRISENPSAGTSGTLPILSSFFRNYVYGQGEINRLGRFSNYLDMQASGVLLIPEYPLSPAVAAGEVDAFDDWFSGWSGEPLVSAESDESTAKEKRKNKGNLKSIKNTAGASTKEFVSQKTGKSEFSDAFDAQKALSLPSGSEGYESSLGNLQEITDILSMAADGNGGLEALPGAEGDANLSEHNASLLNNAVKQIGELGKTLAEGVLAAPETLMEKLYVNAYVLSAFRNRTTGTEGLNADIAMHRQSVGAVFPQGEVEYILFGRASEKQNLAAMEYSLFAVRLAMNLLHVYTTPDKESASLGLATTLAGWTIFGVPVVHNLLMTAWATAETFVDKDKLLKGESVPFLKTSANWYLGAGGIRDELLQNLLIDPAHEKVNNVVDATIGQANDALLETVGAWLDAAVDKAFVNLEAKVTDYSELLAATTEAATEKLPGTVSETIAGFASSLSQNAGIGHEKILDVFEDQLYDWTALFQKRCTEGIKTVSASQLQRLKTQAKAELRAALFQSPFYKGMMTAVQTESANLIDRGFATLEKKADKLVGEGISGQGLKAGISSKLLSFNYENYTSLFLLMMSDKSKMARIGDLVQLNLEAQNGAAQAMKDCETTIFVKAEVSMNYWFIPDAWVKNSSLGTIHAQWGQGY